MKQLVTFCIASITVVCLGCGTSSEYTVSKTSTPSIEMTQRQIDSARKAQDKKEIGTAD